MFNLFRLCRNDEISFDIVAETGNIVAKNGNNVEATVDFVQRTKFYKRIVRHSCRLWQQSRMLLRQSRTLLRHCCWCGWGLTSLAPYTMVAVAAWRSGDGVGRTNEVTLRQARLVMGWVAVSGFDSRRRHEQ